MTLQHGLPDSTFSKIIGVFSSFHSIQKAILYGSRAMGTFKNGSDIDLTLVGEKISGDELHRILRALEELNLPYKFDLSIFHTLTNSGLLDHISKNGKIFYDRSTPS